jgi:glycogen debranching enzyme
LRLRFEADFADIFEVRGTRRKAKGWRLQTEVESNAVTLAYEGRDQVIRQTFISCEPAPSRISESEFQFDISLEARTEAVLSVIIACHATNESPETYESAWLAAVGELNEAHLNVCRIESSNEPFNQWISRSQADVDMMIVGNPECNYPYAGVPWFSTVFGRDGIITALQCLWLNPKIARGVLKYLADTQATEVIPEVDAEPGKIVHEMREGEMAMLGEVPFRRYYGSVDATALFVMLAEAYFRRTADVDFLRQIWPNVERALHWIDNYGDRDGDGFVEYSRQTDTGLVQQGWKDSNDSVFHSDGSMAKGPIALCEVQGYVYAAKQGAAHLAEILGLPARAQKLRTQATALKSKFNDAFWCYDLGTYALALDGEKRPCRVRASNAGHCLYTGIANPENARVVAQCLLSRDFFTAWGIRSVARGEARYNPLSYHNGSVWPHDNSLIAAGLSRYGYKAEASQLLSGLLDASTFIELKRLPELFCGMERRPGEGPTLYPVACSPQAWAAGSAFLLLQACLGLSVDAEKRQIRFDDPFLPEGIAKLYLRGLQVGDCNVDIVLERQDYLVLVHTLEQRGNAEVIVS